MITLRSRPPCSAAARAALRSGDDCTITMRDLMEAGADEKAKTDSEVTRMMERMYT